MKKWYSVEVKPQESEAIGIYCKTRGIRYEASSCFNMVHFEIELMENQVKPMNDFLSRI